MLRKLRVGLVAGVVVLLVVVAGFVWYGRMVARRFKFDLPKRLGIDITQETNNFSYSQSVKGRTVFTVHAAKEVRHANGLITLYDVGIVLPGRKDGGADRISGQEFEFDPGRGVLNAAGDVYLDLAAPGAGAGKGTARTVHVKTSGLVFDQKAQTAVTEQRVEFSMGGVAGSARGAEYDSGAGRVELRSAVRVSGTERSRPAELEAGRAELRRKENVVLLEAARYRTGTQTAAADHGVVHLAPEGGPQGNEPERIEGQGHVVLTGEGRGTMTGERVELALGSGGKVRDGHLWGGVRYGSQERLKSANGAAQDVQVGFDAQGNPAHALATGGVWFEQRKPGGGRALRAERVELALGMAGAGKGKVVVKEADATGGAVLRMAGESPRGRSSSELSADELKAHFVEVAGKNEVSTLEGLGHTALHQAGAGGVEETSKGDTLAISFKEGSSGKSTKAARKASPFGLGAGAVEMGRAVQRGGVTVVRVEAAKASGGKTGPPSGPEVEHASGAEAVYEADGDRLTMRGGVQVVNATSELLADEVEMQRESGDATANGDVRVSYLAGDGKGEPMHILAGRAVEKKGAGMAEFFGAAGRDARMWQGGSAVEAAVLSFFQSGKDKGSRRMVGHGLREGDEVRAVLVSAGPREGAKGRVVAGGAGGPSAMAGARRPAEADARGARAGGVGGTVRIQGDLMTYLGGAGTVEFTGRVQVQDANGRMNAQRAVATLAKKNGSADANGAAVAGGDLLGGRVERVVASGGVEIEQPGRRGTGEQLVYTADDRTFVLTGTKTAPPKVEDEAGGTTTGAALRFRSGDDSVVVSGGVPGEGTEPGKVRSEMRVRQ